jgi:hypothetical protein
MFNSFVGILDIPPSVGTVGTNRVIYRDSSSALDAPARPFIPVFVVGFRGQWVKLRNEAIFPPKPNKLRLLAR